MLQPKLVLGSNFTYQKVFGEDEFFAAGVLNIQVGGSKPSKPSRDNAYVSTISNAGETKSQTDKEMLNNQVFFVNQGCVEVTLHRTRFIMSEGGQFFIPRGMSPLFRMISACKPLTNISVSSQATNTASKTSATRKSNSSSRKPERSSSNRQKTARTLPLLVLPTMRTRSGNWANGKLRRLLRNRKKRRKRTHLW